ncbi:MAG: MBL fold metallo-hydrolase [Candidatus Pacearchaeota archaeon]
MKLTFYGGAGMVTGANYLLEDEKNKFLIDCGLYQGSNFCEQQNFEPFPYNPQEIDYVFITHAHIDHIGRLPKLYRENFNGKIYSTPPTKDFAEFLLIDSEHLLREEAERLKKENLYDFKDIEGVMKLWQKISYHEKIEIGNFEIEFFDAGHILGSSFISFFNKKENKRIVFSGDLGNVPMPLIKPTEKLLPTDYLIIESAYGGRVHEDLEKRKEILEDVIEEVVKSNGVLLIPAFALERTQELLYELNDLVENQKIPAIPIFIDSPLAINLTMVYKKYSQDPMYFNELAIDLFKKGDDVFDFKNLKMTFTSEQSKEILFVKPPKVIIAGAGMSNGGRIIHHEVQYLNDPKNIILFIGYQAEGSLGRKILDGEKEVKILDKKIEVKCQVRSISGYSAHADQKQILNWIYPVKKDIRKIFIVQGEKEQAEILSQKIKDELVVDSYIPQQGEQIEL